MTDDEVRAERARARASWPVRLLRGSDPGDAIVSGNAEDRLRALWTISESVYAMVDKPVTDLPRSAWPGRVIRP